MPELPFVYLMRRADGRWKVGFSADPQNRRKVLKHEMGQSFTLVRTWQMADAYAIEQLAHRFLRLRMDLVSPGKETFRGPRHVMIAAIEKAIRIADTPAPAVEEPEPPVELEDTSEIEAEGARAWIIGAPQGSCPYANRRYRLAWCDGWRRARVAQFIERLTTKEQTREQF